MIDCDINSIEPLKSSTKCGELYFENSIFKCACLFCKNTFETITIFKNHLLEEHLYFKEVSTKIIEAPDELEDQLTSEILNISETFHESQLSTPNIISKPEEISPESPKIISLTTQYLPFHCRLCKNVFPTRECFKVHYKKYHRQEVKPYEPNICRICNKTLASKHSLKLHMGIHNGVGRPYKCRFCPQACALKCNLVQHEKIHNGEKTQKCNFCDKTFHVKFDRNVHERRVHTKERLYQCEICGKKFFTSALMNTHKKRHTNTRNFECTICDKRFYDRSQLKDHMISHTNVKLHTCHICMTKFSRRKALLQHINIHNEIKQYNCLLCDKSFAQKPGLYSHMKSHSKQEKF